MDKFKNDQYRNGYIAGYIDSLRDISAGKTIQTTSSDVEKLPVKAMDISKRGQTCLIRAGCAHIADVAALSKHRIANIRNMGPVTASEIARWLDEHNIRLTNWAEYL